MKGIFSHLVVLALGLVLGAWWMKPTATRLPPQAPKAMPAEAPDAAAPKALVIAQKPVNAEPVAAVLAATSPEPQRIDGAAINDYQAERAERVSDFEARLGAMTDGTAPANQATQVIWDTARQLEQRLDVSLQEAACDDNAHCMYKLWGNDSAVLSQARSVIAKALSEQGYKMPVLGVSYDHAKSEGGPLTMMVENLGAPKTGNGDRHINAEEVVFTGVGN